MKNTVSWDMTPCSLVEAYMSFGRTYVFIFRAGKLAEEQRNKLHILRRGREYRHIEELIIFVTRLRFRNFDFVKADISQTVWLKSRG
jgi:hypothetical protein